MGCGDPQCAILAHFWRAPASPAPPEAEGNFGAQEQAISLDTVSPVPLHPDHLARFATLNRRAKDGPLTPALSPSEGERGNRRQVSARFMGRVGVRGKEMPDLEGARANSTPLQTQAAAQEF